MRFSALLLAACACCAPLFAYAADPLPYIVGPQRPGFAPNAIFLGETYKTVALAGDAALAKLRATNAHDYDIALRVMDAAGEFCAPDAPKPRIADVKSEDIVCSAAMYPSNPPKRVLWFKVGHTLYQLLVTLPTERS